MENADQSNDIDAIGAGAGDQGCHAWGIALCAAASLLDGYDVQALGIAIPGMATEFGLPPASFAVAASLSLVGMALGSMLLSPLADRYGRRPTMITLLMLVALATGASLTVHGPVDLALWRFAAGLGLGALVPVAIALTAENSPSRFRPVLVTMIVAGTAMGAFAGGMLAPFLDTRWGWRGIFALGAAVPLVLAALAWLKLPESLAFLISRRPQSDVTIRRLAAVGLTADWRPRDTDLTTKGSSTRFSLPILFSQPFRFRTILLWTICWFNLFVNYSIISWLPSLLIASNWRHADASRATGLVAAGGVAGAFLLAMMVRRLQLVPVLLFAYVTGAIVLSLFAALPPHQIIWWSLLLLVGASVFGGQLILAAQISALYPPTVRSGAIGWAAGVGRIGSFIGPLLIALLMAAGVAPNLSVGLLAIPMLACVACVMLLPRALANEDGPPQGTIALTEHGARDAG